MIVAAAGAVDESDGIVVADAVDVAIGPNFDADGLLRSTGMRINFVRWTINDIDVAAIGLPAGGARDHAEVLVSEGDASVVLNFESVCR
jgi:hypothetical protein